MAIVDENRLKGNFGAHYISSLLAYDCLIRPVAADTDVGIDLYCETLADGSIPFLHFWIQAKSGKQCRIVEEGDRASCSFEVEDLEYWRRQPVPVYAALVPEGECPSVYLVDITQQPRTSKERNQKEVTLRSDFVWRPGHRPAVQEFLSKVVPYDTALLSLFRLGTFAKVPTLQAEYEITLPLVPIEPFLATILNQIRTTAANSILALYTFGGLDRHIDARTMLASILQNYCESPLRDDHYETYFARGLCEHADQNFDKAIAHYGTARGAIHADQQITHPEWIAILEGIERNIERAKRGETPTVLT